MATKILTFRAVGVEWSLKFSVVDGARRIDQLLILWCSTPGAEAAARIALGVDDWRPVEALKPFVRAPGQVEALEMASLSFGSLPSSPLGDLLRGASEALLAFTRNRSTGESA